MESSALCRVCLASDRAVHRLADTPLEETYERVTRETLVVEGRPCCVCGVCLSALRRCRRFVEAAHRANIALDRWSRSPRAKMKLTETPLFSFSRSVTAVFEITSLCQPAESAVKLESDNADNEDEHMLQQVLNESTSNDEDKFFTKDIKYEVNDDLDGDEKDNAQGSDDENDDIQISAKAESDNTHCSDDDDDNNSQILHSFESVHIYKEERDVDNKPEKLEDIKLDTPEVLDNGGDETVPGTSKVKQDRASSDEDTPLQSLGSRKRVKLTDDTSVPAVKKWRPITAGDQPGNTSPSPAVHKDGNMFSCRECQYKTGHKESLMKHLKKYTEEKPFARHKCNLKGSLQQNFKVHSMIYTGKKLFACTTCDYKCSYKSDLKKHIMIHTGEKPFKCDKCDFKSRRKCDLNSHLMIHTGEKPFKCDVCEFKSKSKCGLKTHFMIHTGEKPFKCEICDFKSSHKGHLKTHLLIHTGEKPFKCNICDFKCIQKSYLSRHLMIHTGEKPFKCDTCNFKSRRKCDLMQHLMIHTGEKPFKCDVCNFKCNQKTYLSRHLMIHTGEKPFACDKCDYKSNRKSNLITHFKIHTGKKTTLMR